MRMDIYSPPGTKVIFDSNGGYDHDKQEAAKVLKLGETYTVRRIDVRLSHSYVFLEEVSLPGGFGFNTVMFKAVSKSDSSLT